MPLECRLMAILNLTDDSFSGDGWLRRGARWADELAAEVDRLTTREFVTVVDLGAESTRPGSEPLAEAAELEVIEAAFEAVAPVAGRLRLSIDTYKPAVADLACRLGASMVNDVTGHPHPEMWATAAAHGAELVVMHNTASWSEVVHDPALGSRFTAAGANDPTSVLTDVAARADDAEGAGVPRVWLDPGIGFGKSVEENWELLRAADRFVASGRPVLVGPSRKSFLGWGLDRPVTERDPATAAVVGHLARAGVQLVRVHDADLADEHLRVLAALRP